MREGALGARRGWAAVLVLLPLLATWWRGFAHPVVTLDLECTFVANVGRVVRHGHLADIAAYQIDFWRGVPLIDGALAALGFLLFGDHLLAWHAVTFVYLAVTTALGMAILRRTSGDAAAVLFPILLAVAPFLVRDGLISGLAGHTHALAFVMLATWLTLRAADAEERPGVPWGAVLAGAAFGLGMFYQRSVLAIAPALFVLLRPRGWRSLFAFGAGTLLLPLLMVANTAAILESGTSKGENGFLSMLRLVISGISGAPEAWSAGKVFDVFGVGWGSILFAPEQGTLADGPRLPGSALGHLWTLVWIGGAIGAVALARRSDRGMSVALAPLLLAGGYAIAYVLAPFRVEPAVLELIASRQPLMPTVSDVRYIVPVFVLWTLVAAHTLGGLVGEPNRAGRIARRLAWILVGGGILLTLHDALSAGASPSVYGEVLPYRFADTYDAWDGPPPDTHLACDSDDPVDRAHHWRALGQGLVRSMEYIDPSQRPDDALDFEELVAGADLGPRAQQFVAHGMGRESAEASFVLEQERWPDLLRALRRDAEALGPVNGEAFLVGVTDVDRLAAVGSTPEEAAAALCAPTSWGTRPLCPLLAWRAPLHLDSRSLPNPEVVTRWAQDVDPNDAIRSEIVRGIGMRYGYLVPPSLRAEEALQPWSPADRAVLRDGMARGGRTRWQGEGPLDQQPPWQVP